MRAEGFSCSLDVLYGGLGISKKRHIKSFQQYFFYFYFLVIKTLDPDPFPNPDSLEMLDPDPDSSTTRLQSWLVYCVRYLAMFKNNKMLASFNCPLDLQFHKDVVL